MQPEIAEPARETLAEAQVRFPTVPIVFCENRSLAQEWTYRFLGAALTHAAEEAHVGAEDVESSFSKGASTSTKVTLSRRWSSRFNFSAPWESPPFS